MNLRVAIFSGLSALLAFVVGCAPERSEREDWNQGVRLYHKGNATNALHKLRGLLSSPEYGARAAHLVAKIEYELGNIDEAARAAQIALRANPKDPVANRNYARAFCKLPEFREMKRTDKAVKSIQGRDPGSIMLCAAHEARRLLEETGGYTTNAAEKAVELSDSLSDRAEALSDLLLALSATVADKNEATQFGEAMGKTRLAARRISDIDPEAYPSMSDVEHDCTRLLKMKINPPDAIAEDLIAQSNAWQDVEAFNGRAWQNDALDYTSAFLERFRSWALDYEQQAQSDTNKPPFTAEDQEKVSELATELKKIQMECIDNPLPPRQEQALDIIRQIGELLPKGSETAGSQRRQDRQSGEGQPQGRQGCEEGQDDGLQDVDTQKQEPKEAAAEESYEEEKEMDAILRMAQERSDEHEADKKARMRKVPLPPNERDW